MSISSGHENWLQVIAGATMGKVGLLLVNAPNPGGISARPFARPCSHLRVPELGSIVY